MGTELFRPHVQTVPSDFTTDTSFSPAEIAYVAAGAANVVTESGELWPDQFPAASLARTVAEYAVEGCNPVKSFEAVVTVP
jgi:hypothetical protein